MRTLNNPELQRRVDAYLAARTSVLWAAHRQQRTDVTELDASARAQELRDWWEAHPGCVWNDGAERNEEIEVFWSVELLINELDARAQGVCDSWG